MKLLNSGCTLLAELRREARLQLFVSAIKRKLNLPINNNNVSAVIPISHLGENDNS